MTIPAGRASVRVLAPVLATAALAWLAMIQMAYYMPPAPGTSVLAAPAFIGLWTVMMSAMMLPAIAPLGVLYAGERRGRPGRLAGLAIGHLTAWTAVGVGLIVVGILAPSHPGIVPGLQPPPSGMAGM